MALSSPATLKIEYDNGSGTPVDITQYVLTINDISVESVLEEMHPFGTPWEAYMPVGIGKIAPVELGGLWDDTVTTGPDALFSGRVPEVPGTAITRTLKVTWKTAGKYTNFETYLISYDRTAERNNLTKFKVKLQPTGAITEG